MDDKLIQQSNEYIARELKRRSSLTESNALMFKDFFDLAIKAGEALVPWEFPGFIFRTPATCYRKIVDARKLLAVGFKTLTDDEVQKYRLFKALSKFDIEDKGIRIVMNSASRRVGTPSMTQTHRIDTNWRDTFDAWVESGDKPMFNLNNLHLSEDDQEYVRATCRLLGAECKVTMDSIKAVRDE